VNEAAYAIVGRISLLLITAAQPLLIYMVSRMLRRLDDITTELKIQNGNVKTNTAGIAALEKRLQLLERLHP